MLRDIENLRDPIHDNICYSVWHLIVLYFRTDSSDVMEDLLKGLNEGTEKRNNYPLLT